MKLIKSDSQKKGKFLTLGHDCESFNTCFINTKYVKLNKLNVPLWKVI